MSKSKTKLKPLATPKTQVKSSMSPLDELQLKKGTLITKIEMLQMELREVNEKIFGAFGREIK